jgi:aspartate aminotransferase
MCYGIPVVVTPEDGTFYPRFERDREAVSSYTKAIIINSPNNPSGDDVLTKSLSAEMVEFCESKGIYLIMDDIYHKLVFDGKKA